MKRKNNFGLVVAIVVILLLMIARVVVDINCKNKHKRETVVDDSVYVEVYDLATDTYIVK